MNTYIYAIISICIIGSYLTSVIDNDSKTSRYVSYIIALSLVCCLVKPTMNIFSFFTDINDQFKIEYNDPTLDVNDELNVLLLDETDKQLKKGISDILSSKFNMNLLPEKISLTYDAYDKQNIKISKIQIDTRDIKVIKDLYEMRYFISEMFMCECEVI